MLAEWFSCFSIPDSDLDYCLCGVLLVLMRSCGFPKVTTHLPNKVLLGELATLNSKWHGGLLVSILPHTSGVGSLKKPAGW